ncbi:AfsR/SARP family transcriptional regulator [Actinomadura sp. 7K534]|uniref:AfsR/SARP family transcriptional regulator n=1 Tax=Actinomadura sp. 7K534 TaxID=2530366 RepID=UPI001404D607|nr:AfsR/SARP family transcriptional regulator [Actinomadura sp. 7K534]
MMETTELRVRSRGTLSVRLLGPLDVSVDGIPIVLTPGRLRTLLAVLALSAGRAVSIESLAAVVWAHDDPPRNVRRSVQTYIARLRCALGEDAIRSGPAGYVLATDPERVDALMFPRLLSMASAAPDPATERARLGEALSLWRGRPFDGVPSPWLAESKAPWLVERYLTALESRLDLDIAAGRYAELAVELSELTARHPLRESLWARLLIVLGRSGRRAEALARYETIRTRIAGELGVDPDPTLQRLHADLLTIGAPRPSP